MNPPALFLCLALVFFAVFPAHAESIIVASDEWCPFNCGPEDPLEGYAVDILRAIFEPAGIEVDYRVMGWERAVEEGRRGHVTAIIGAVREEAEGFVIPEEEIGLDLFAFFVRKDDPWRYRGAESLRGKRLGVPAGYLLPPDLEAFYDSHDKEDIYRAGRERPTRHNLRLLMEGRLDIVADDAKVVCYLAHSMNFRDSIEYAGYEDEHDKLYIAFSPARPDSAHNAELFDKGIRALRESGRLSELLAPYGLIDWRERFSDIR
jgi:polar amino acid transport system substrate-binding protein